MIFRISALLLVVLAVAASVSAGERKFDLTVSLEGGSVRIDRAEAVAKVRITNRSREDLKTSGLGEVNFYFSTCEPGDPSCDGSEFYYARAKVPAATLYTDRSFEFRVDLAKLWWKKGPYNPQLTTPSYNLEAVPSENIYFYADVKVLDGFVENQYTGKQEPEYRVYLSNTVNAILV